MGDLFKSYIPVAEQADSGRENTMRLMRWLDDPISKVQLDAVITHDIDLWIARRIKEPSTSSGKPIKPATVSRELNLMSGAFTWAAKTRKWITVNPCHGAMRPAKARLRKRQLLTRQEIEAICISSGYVDGHGPETLTAKVGGCFLLALETGMRSGEILRLQPRDYVKKNRTVHVRAIERGGRKGARSGRNDSDPSRDVPLTERAIQILDNLLLAMPEDQKAKEGFSAPPPIVGMNDSQRDSLWRKVRDRAAARQYSIELPCPANISCIRSSRV